MTLRRTAGSATRSPKWRALLVVLSLCAAGQSAVAAASAAPASAAPATAHPRLLFSAADLPTLRKRIAAGGVPSAAWQRVVERAEEHLVKVSPAVVRANVGIPMNLQGAEKTYNLQNEMPSYLIHLGMAYQVSEDKRYGRHAVALLLALADAGWPFWSGQELGIGDLLEGVGLAFDWTYQIMTPEERTKIVQSLTTHDQELFDRVLINWKNQQSSNPTTNWSGVTGGGVGLTLLAIRGEPGAPPKLERYLQLAKKRVRLYFEQGFDPMGAHMEGHQYMVYGLKNAIPFAMALKREGLGDIIAGTGLPQIPYWQAMEQLPGEGQQFVPLNDSVRAIGGVDLAALNFAVAPRNGVAQWIWNRTVGEKGNHFYKEPHVSEVVLEGQCSQFRFTETPIGATACPIGHLHGNVFALLYYRTPEETPEVDPAKTGPLSVWHPHRGLVDTRTGFSREAGEVISTFEAHRDGTAHFQYDVGHFTVYGYGGRFAIDAGNSCVGCGNTDPAGYAPGHNVILVDEQKETQYRFLRYFTGTTIDSFIDAPTLTLTHADLRYAYNFEAPIADRDHLFGRSPGRPVLVAVGDSLQRDKIPFEKAMPNDHVYTWQMLSQLPNRVSPRGSGFTITAPNGATMVGRAARDGDPKEDPTFQYRFFAYTQFMEDMPGQHVVYSATPKRQRIDQLTVMAVTPAGEPPATQESIRVKGGNAIAVDWKGVREVVVRRLALSRAVTGPIATDATMAKYTKNAGDTVLRGGTRLAGEGREYVRVTGRPATVTVSGSVATATGASGNRYRVFAPQPLSATTVNGAAVRSCRQGTYVTFPCAPNVRSRPVDVRPAQEQLPRTGVPAQPAAASPPVPPQPRLVASRNPYAVPAASVVMLLACIAVGARRRHRRWGGPR